MDNTIQRINLCPVDSAIIGFPNTYLLDSDLSGGERYTTFEQLGPHPYPLDSDLPRGERNPKLDNQGQGRTARLSKVAGCWQKSAPT